jgi:cation diffusion facilitator family transporter
MWAPEAIAYPQAMAVTLLGLAVNLLSAKWLGHGHAHAHNTHHLDHHHHEHEHPDHDHDHEDLNLKAAYLHVLADAATSVLALLALAGAWWLGWAWLDPAMGLVGAALVAVWALGLLRQSARVLLDGEMDNDVTAQAQQALSNATQRWRIEDMHLWRVGAQAYAITVTASTTDTEVNADTLRQCLTSLPMIVHTTIEVRRD